MLQKLKALASDPVLFGTAVITVGLFVGSFFSYLLQFFLARLLSVEDYGVFNAFLSLSYIISAPAAVFSISLIKLITQLKASEKYDSITQLFWFLAKVFFVFTLMVIMLMWLLRFLISDFINVHNEYIILPFSVVLGLTYLVMIPNAYLQGLLRYKAISLFTMLASFLRFGLALIAVMLGLKVFGIFSFMSLAMVISFGVGALVLKKNFKAYEREDLKPYYKKLVAFSTSVVLINLFMLLINNIDVILVKRYFDTIYSGYYASVVTVGKILLFGAGTVSTVMFPQIAEAYAKRNHYLSKFFKFLLLQVGVVLIGVVVFILFPSQIIVVMFGEKFLPAVPYLPRFSIFMGMYVLVNFLVMYFLAIEKTKIVYLQLPFVVLQFILLNVFKDSINSVINVNILTLALLLGVLGFYVGKTYKDQTKDKSTPGFSNNTGL